MKTVINKSGEFTYLAELNHVNSRPGSYHLSIQSIWGEAKDPTAQRTLVQITTDNTGLTALRDLINQAVTPTTA